MAALVATAEAGCGQGDPSSECAGNTDCAALYIDAPALGAATLDQLEIGVHAGDTHRWVSFHDRVLNLPATVAVSLPELASAAGQAVSLYLRAAYEGRGLSAGLAINASGNAEQVMFTNGLPPRALL